MRSESARSGAGDEEQRKEDERDIDWIFSFVVSSYFCDRYFNIFAFTVMNKMATSLKRIIE